MFDAIRNKSRILMGVLVLLIIPSFVLFGVEGYNNRDDRGAVVAQIGDLEITQQQWDAMHQQEVDKIRASMPNLDPKMLGSAEARYASLERMVNDRMIAVASEKQLLVTSDQRLANYLKQDPSIASLRGPDGKLDMDRYRQLASSQGMTPEMLEAQVRRDLSGQQVLSALQASAMSSQNKVILPCRLFSSVVRFNSLAFHLPTTPPRSSLQMQIWKSFTNPTLTGSALQKVQTWSIWCWTLLHWPKPSSCQSRTSKPTMSKTCSACLAKNNAAPVTF